MRSSFVSTFIIFKDIKVVRVAIVADVQILSFPKILRLQGLFKLYHFKDIKVVRIGEESSSTRY